MTESTDTVSLEEIDLSSHDAFVERVPHEWFRTLRREAPVFFNPEPDGPGFYAVTRYWDIREVIRNFVVYSSEVGGTSLEDLEPEQIEARKSMIDTDPPRHTELRKLIARRFTSRAVKVWEEAVRTVCDRVLTEALPKGEFDFVREISSEIPMQVFAEILGVPQQDRRLIVDMGDRILGNQDPEFAQEHLDDSHRMLPFSSPVALEMFEFGRKLAAARRENPRDDIVSLLVKSDLTQREFDVYFVLLATAGNETTRHTITHGLLALLEYPDQLERLRQDPSLYGPAADEMLRWATAVHHFRRTTTQEAELAGTKIPAGAKVATWLVSGNRDEEVFENPDTFDVGREPNKHMAFGPGGVHHCLGAHLARMEVRVVFEEMLRRVDGFELTGPPERLRSNFFNGIKRLPVRVTA
jgi:cytochrome P450